ncbi:hypothetical protein YC2023_078009 [Brassica napus]
MSNCKTNIYLKIMIDSKLVDSIKKTHSLQLRFVNEMKKETLMGLVLGQIISLLSTSISFTTSELARKGFTFFSTHF